MVTEVKHLGGGLKKRHLTMIGLGGVIGAGLFVGSGTVIQQAGPASLLSYAIAGTLVVLVMRMLGEMAAENPDTGSFAAYAERGIGRWAGFAIGWLYAWMGFVTLAVEATAAAVILNRWAPDVPQWTWALIIMVVLTAANLVSARFFGEFEYWFSGIKVAAIVAFLLIGIAALLGFFPGVTTHPIENLLGHGGFFPMGGFAAVTAILVVMFAYFGAEVVAIAAAESDNPKVTIRAAIRSILWRVLIFYIGSILLVLLLMPWDQAQAKTSPFVTVLNSIGLDAAGVFMDIVVLTAVLSCLNAGIYATSRVVFSLSARGHAPRSWQKVSNKGNPRIAILIAVALGFVAVILNYYYPDTIFLFLVHSTAGLAFFVWLTIAVSQLRLRRQMQREGKEPAVKMWLFPYLTYVAMAMIVALCIMQAVLPETSGAFSISLGLTATVVIIALVRFAWRDRRDKQQKVESPAAEESAASDAVLEPTR